MTGSLTSLSRRRLLQAGAGAIGLMAGGLAAPAVRAQAPTAVRFTLPWLAEGATAYVYVARELGLYRQRGLEVEISRGFGSNAAAQAVAQGQFDIGVAAVSAILLQACRGLPIVSLATINYDMGMGVCVRADSPIRQPSDLAGRRIGIVPASAEAPFFPAYLRRINVARESITVQQLDPRVRESTLIDRQVDAITGIGSSAIPILQARNEPHRFMLYSAAGLQFYGNAIMTRPEVLSARRIWSSASSRRRWRRSR